jgi:hypothetical protein
MQILTDVSFLISFNGATDSKGNPTDSSQGTTTWQIKTDGSYEFTNSSVDIQANKSGTLNITTKTDCNITATGNATVDGKNVKLGANAIDTVIKGDTFKKYLDALTVATSMGPSGPPIIPMPPSTLSTKVKTE